MIPPASSWCDVPCENPTAAPSKRSEHACAMYKDCLYVFGGTGSSSRLNDFYEFSFPRKTWKFMPSTGRVPSPRCGHVAVVYKDSLYVFAGYSNSSYFNDLTEYNFLTQTWSSVVVRGGTPPTPRGYVSAVVYDKQTRFYDQDIKAVNY